MYRTTGLLSLEGLSNNTEVFTSSAGLFDECLAIEAPSFQGKYCSTFFKKEAILDENIFNVSNRGMNERGRQTYRLPQVGFCIPSSCTSLDLRSAVSQLIASKSNGTSFVVTITDENYCYTQKKMVSTPQFDGPDIAVMYKASMDVVILLKFIFFSLFFCFQCGSQSIRTTRSICNNLRYL